MSVPTPTRCRVLPAAVALVAVLALAGPAPAAQGGGYPPPNHPSAVPEAPGALTGTHARTPSDVNAALAAERSYSSYGDAPSPAAPAAPTGGRDGIGVAPFVMALAGALVLGLAVGGLAPLAHARRRHRVGIAS